jgi:ABC-2 type transport system ATP-binding protein
MIHVNNVTKDFGPKRAVDGVSFAVNKGEILGFLGPNGAGKSTTMRMITGYFPPSSGSVEVGGHDVLTKPIEAKRLIGYLPENAPAYSDMSVYDFLAFAAAIRGVKGNDRKKAIDKVIELCFLETVRHQSIDTLSKGYRHRTCFAQSIIHDPPVLILDEPTDGLDPNQKHEVRSIIKRMGEVEKKAIVFSTHILEEVEAVCSRAIIIDRGKVVANGTPLELKARSRSADAILVTVSGALRDAARNEFAALAGAASVDVVTENAGTLTCRVIAKRDKTSALEEAVFDSAVKRGWKLLQLQREEGRLDEVFRAITLPDTAKAA